MALGQATVTTENLGQGEFKTVENQFLFLGKGKKNIGKVLYLSGDSDLDKQLGADPSRLKTTVNMARLNGGEGWTSVVIPLAAGDGDAEPDWQSALDKAMDENVKCEGVFITDPLTRKALLGEMFAAVTEIENRLARRLFIKIATRDVDYANESWDDFIAEVNDYTDGVAAFRVGPVAEIIPGFMGIYAGRLARTDLSVGDTPMRVRTGTLIGFNEMPTDKDGKAFNNGYAKALNDARYTVPQLYADFDGIYCSDGQLLDAEAGDFQVIENLRIVDKAARRVRILAIRKVGDRELNSTPISISNHETYFLRPLIEMSQSVTFNDRVIPGDIYAPDNDDIVIKFITRTQVVIYMQVQPVDTPKKIRVAISLDLSGIV